MVENAYGLGNLLHKNDLLVGKFYQEICTRPVTTEP